MNFENLLGFNLKESKNLKIALFAFAIGLISYASLKKLLCKSYNYPAEIEFSKNAQLGANKTEFLKNLQNDHENCLQQLQKAYPNECTLSLGNSLFGNQKIIFLNSYESVKKFSKEGKNAEPIPSRPKSFLLDFLSKGYLGSFFRLYDEKLLEIRKSSLSGLHKLIGTDPNFETKLTDELQLLFDFFNEEFIDGKKPLNKLSQSKEFSIEMGNEDGLIVDAPLYFQQISTNIITMIGLGVRFDYESNPTSDIKFQMNNISEALNSLNLPNILNFGKLDSFCKKDTLAYLTKRVNSVYEFLLNAVNGYKSNYDPDVLATFADYVIGKQAEKLKANKVLKDDDVYSDKDILVQVFTLLMAGTCTTGFTLSWAFYYLAKNPAIQNAIFDEILRNTGIGAFIHSRQHVNLPYTDACINEILRLSSTQTLIQRSTDRKVNVESYSLPENTAVLVNTFAIHRDPKYWKSDQMNPEQWFDENKNLISHLDSFVPFGFGARSCIGDVLARQILFLVIANLVQRFQFEYVSSGTNENLKQSGNSGVMRRPYNYHLKITRRT